MSNVRPKKHLGQHFLTDKNTARKISQTLQAINYSKILEIGPGTGMLTQYLLERPEKEIYVVEIDGESIDFLKKNYAALKHKIIEKDFLKLDLKELFAGEAFGITGNFPYNISTQILFKVLDDMDLVPEFSGMFQKEVAERITAQHGNKIYGILSVLVQTYYDVDYLFTVNENIFYPPPKVKSGVIRLIRKTKKPNISYGFLKELVKTAFSQRRKTLRNSLKSYNLSENLKQDSIFAMRPEQLSVVQFEELAIKIKNDPSRT